MKVSAPSATGTGGATGNDQSDVEQPDVLDGSEDEDAVDIYLPRIDNE